MPTVDPKSVAENHVLAEQVYDMLMAQIEPDLLLINIPLIDAKYAGETPEQTEERMKRYAAAYKKFDAELAKFMNEVDTNVRTTQRAALQQKEQQDRDQESNTLNSIASAFA